MCDNGAAVEGESFKDRVLSFAAGCETSSWFKSWMLTKLNVGMHHSDSILYILSVVGLNRPC